MGLFSRRRDPERERARAIATRGVQAVARVEAMRETGVTKGPAKEVGFRLRFTPDGGTPAVVDISQMMNDTTLTGLGPGVDASISYDRDDPTVAVVWHAASVRIVDGIAVAAPPPAPPPPPDDPPT